MTFSLELQTPLACATAALDPDLHVAFAGLAAIAAERGRAIRLTIDRDGAGLRMRDPHVARESTALLALPDTSNDKLDPEFSGHAVVTLAAGIAAADLLRAELTGLFPEGSTWRLAGRPGERWSLAWSAGLPEMLSVAARDLGSVLLLARRLAPVCLAPATGRDRRTMLTLAVRLPPQPLPDTVTGFLPASDLAELWRLLAAWQAGMLEALSCLPDPPVAFVLQDVGGIVPVRFAGPRATA